MKCPYCSVAFHDDWFDWYYYDDDGDESKEVCDGSGVCWRVFCAQCPECLNLIFRLHKMSRINRSNRRTEKIIVYPKHNSRPVPPEVDEKFAQDFREACLVIAVSEKASAALSRRCLQNLLREKSRVKASHLVQEIQDVIASNQLPNRINESLDAVRQVGNFATHPVKSKNTGEVIDVEPAEAEWLLDTLEQLFEFYFVEPARLKKQKAALNKKLKDAGKPLLK
ncbi:MAG: DUF4145 domain-containing protein [Acidobacteriota bacterium]|nr:DUF4145 domain-containing protein [Acidobacteriota bacterium]